jgi:hypothetical protein
MEAVTVLYDCSYHHTRPHMAASQQLPHRYPCVQHVDKNHNPSCVWWSATNSRGHFGKPKVIFGRKQSGVMVDRNGSYGMCQDCTALVDEPENLDRIAAVLRSEQFLRLMESAHPGGLNGDVFPLRVMRLFRKDFWRDFENAGNTKRGSRG